MVHRCLVKNWNPCHVKWKPTSWPEVNQRFCENNKDLRIKEGSAHGMSLPEQQEALQLFSTEKGLVYPLKNV